MGSYTAKLSVLLLGFVMLAHATPAWADDPDDGPPPPPPGPMAPLPVYPAPLSQTTQTTYVPQSVALSGPEEITEDVDETRPVPAGYTAVNRKRKGLIIGGAVTFGATYFVSVMTAAIGEDTRGSGTNPVASLWVPVAGPFLQLGHTDSATAKVFLVGLGGAQLAGAIMLYYGLTTTKRVFVRNDLVSNMIVAPMAGDGATGLSLSGRF